MGPGTTLIAHSNAGYLAPSVRRRAGATYARELAFAQERGWPHTVMTGGHLHFLFDPVTVAAEILSLIERLPRP